MKAIMVPDAHPTRFKTSPRDGAKSAKTVLEDHRSTVTSMCNGRMSCLLSSNHHLSVSPSTVVGMETMTNSRQARKGKGYVNIIMKLNKTLAVLSASEGGYR